MSAGDAKGSIETITQLLQAIVKDMRFAAENEEEKKKLELFRERLLESLPSLIVPKVCAGLLEWSLLQMGRDCQKYMNQAFWDWMTLSELLEHGLGVDPLQALLHTPFTFPGRARKTPRVTFSRFGEKYEPLVRKLREIKGQHRNDPTALHHDLQHLLPESSKGQVKRYVEMEPSQIALDYLCRKYKLPFGSEALKKIILVQKDPMKLAEKFVQDYVRERKR